jgi:tRNA(fMet)-specific endonuclease VapC
MIGSMDLLIAAHAVSFDVRPVTHNSLEFGRVPGLKIEDWQYWIDRTEAASMPCY